jgi:hypothetical protein
MAYEYGSLDLGIRNPFRMEGSISTAGGLTIAILGLWLLLGIAELVAQDRAAGIVNFVIGLGLLASGLALTGKGLSQVMRFFVGRSIPTSLAFNSSQSELGTAIVERKDVQYSNRSLEQMLMGRKNLTFVEPSGWIARLIHSVFPQLTFLPHPIRNIAQRLSAALIKTGIAIVAFTLAWFTSVTGIAGNAGDTILPLFSSVLLAYLLVVWYRAGKPVPREVARNMETTDSRSLAWVLALSIVVPVGLGMFYGSVIVPALDNNAQAAADWETFRNALSGYSPGAYIVVLGALAAMCSAVAFFMVSARARVTNPVTEVSELRANWQESVHPQEIFINIDNIVMANRRYKEVPNRVYNDKEAFLIEQSQAKGTFKGELIQETQPVFKPAEHHPAFQASRLLATVSARVLIVVAAGFCVAAGFHIAEAMQTLQESDIGNREVVPWVVNSAGLFKLVMGGVISLIFGLLLMRITHFFWGEMQFESLLIYFKCDGTFTESTLSTGTSIYDSTRSENTLVRSSITPWIIVSRIMTTTFAGVGERNLEYGRWILEMHRADDDLQAITDDLKGFLGDREAIASIRNEKDLSAASNIFQINQESRAHSNTARLPQEAEEAGGAVKQIERDEQRDRQHDEQ